MSKKHLVIGGLGFLGSELVRKLQQVAPADKIHIVDLNWFNSPVPANAVWEKKNAWDLEEADFRGFDSVVMLSGLANDKVVAADLRGNFRDNLALPTYIGWLAREAGVRRFIFSSTMSLYESSGDELWTEEMAPRPQSPASVVKWQVERALESWCSESFSTILFRLGTICGWSARPRLDLVINTMCKTAICDRKISVHGSSVWRSPVSVENAAEIMALACVDKTCRSGIYNLVEGAYTLKEIGEAVATEARALEIPVTLECAEGGPQRNFRVDGARVHADFPQVQWQNPRSIARSVLEHLRHIPAEKLEDANYYNFLQFQKSSPS